MTAINSTVQPLHKCLHVVSDAATYDTPTGIVLDFASKAIPVPQWPGVIAARGSAKGHVLVAAELSRRFPSFDSLVNGFGSVFPKIAVDCEITKRNLQLFIAGWSFERNAPESYIANSASNIPAGITEKKIKEIAAAGGFDAMPVPFKLIKLPPAIAAPIISPAIARVAGYCGVFVDEAPERVIAQMHLAIKCQRHDVHEGVSHHYIGGFAELTTVTPDGILQRVLSRWPEDRVGKRIHPSAPDWHEWKSKYWGELEYSRDKNPFGFNHEMRERFKEQIKEQIAATNAA